MLSLLVAVAVSAALWTTGGGSLTSGFPSLEELRANGSLVDRYSTHDGELRSVPDVRSTCSGSSSRIRRIAFIALPGPGDGMRRPPVLRFVGNGPPKEIELNRTFEQFGPFGYEKSFSPPMNISFSDGDMLETRHPPYEDSDLRLLHQVGTDARNICWSIEPGPMNCQSDYDYPLLAIETDPPGCIEGEVVVDVLKRLWENRTLPVLYSSPEREISVDCSESNPVITRILVGAYNLTSGEGPPQIKIGDQTWELPTPSPSITFISPSVITSAPTLDQPQPPLTTGSPSQTPTSPSSSPTDVTSDQDNSDSEASSSTGVIVGAVVGLILAVLLFLAVAVLLVFILCRRKSAKYGVEEEKEEREIASESGGAPMDNPVYSEPSTEEYSYVSTHRPHPLHGGGGVATSTNEAYGVRLGGEVAESEGCGAGGNEEVELSGNVAYTATGGGGAGEGEHYDYVTRSDVLITTTPNEAYGTNSDVSVSTNQAYGLVQS